MTKFSLRGMRSRSLGLAMSFAFLGAALACAGSEQGAGDNSGGAATMTLTSSAFAAGKPIPKKFTGEGANVSPPLAWSGAPAATRQFALICDDPDAPMAEPYVHWVLYQIPRGTTSLAEAAKGRGIEGRNSARRRGYTGPMPPRGHGLHHYHFKVYALDTALALGPGATKKDLLRAMKGHVLARGELIGTYQRK